MIKTRKLEPHVQQAIKCGFVPTLRNWRDLPRSELTRAERNMTFCEEYLVVPEGPLVGQPIVLAPFQEAFFYSVYDSPDVVSLAILSMARKNSKTATIACIVMVHVVGPEAKLNSRISSGAQSRKQAAEVYNYASKMVLLSDKLRNICRLVPSSKQINGLPMNVEYAALSAEGKTAHGGSPILAVMDEVGQIKGPQNDFFEAVETSQGAYDDPLMIIISTQAPTDADLLSVKIDDAIRSQDKSIVCHLYTAAADCELGDEAQWKAANPAIGLFRSEKDVREKSKQAQRMPSNEAGFRVLYLNQRVNMVAAFVSASVWKQGNGQPHQFEGPVYGGLDLSATTDLTSLVLVNRQEENLGVQAYFWMPADSVSDASKRDRAPYDVWVKQGLIRTTPGRVIDYGFVARDIAAITADMDIAEIAFDRWRMDRLKAELERAGIELELTEFGQGYASMSPALDALESELLQERVRHGGNPPLAMCAANAVVVPDPAGNRKLDKSKATGRIDGMVALTMAVGSEAKAMDTTEFSPWDDPNFELVAV